MQRELFILVTKGLGDDTLSYSRRVIALLSSITETASKAIYNKHNGAFSLG